MLTSRVKYFLAVWRKRSFKQAALSCGVTQPSLTYGIKTLEEKLGGPLFHRHPHVVLTDLGRRVLPHVKRMEKAAKAAASEAAGSGALSPDHTRRRISKGGDGSQHRLTLFHQ